MGSGHGRLGGSVRASGASSSELLEVGNLASSGPAAGVEAGALFVYSLAEHVNLRAHGSTLVPFAQQRVNAATMTWVDSPGAPPRSAVRFANSTSQTLPAGPIAFFADHGFVGESSLARLKPGERRFITYGLDLDVEVQPEATRASEEPKRLVWDKAAGALEEHFFRTTDAAYTIENRSGHPRSVVLAMTLDRNATLTGPDQVNFDAATSRPLAVFVVAAQKRVERKTHAVEGLVRATAFTALTAGRMSEIASAPSLDAADKGAASQAAARLHEAEEDARKATQTKGEIAEVEKDLDRLREHMKALAGERSGGGAGPIRSPRACSRPRIGSRVFASSWTRWIRTRSRRRTLRRPRSRSWCDEKLDGAGEGEPPLPDRSLLPRHDVEHGGRHRGPTSSPALPRATPDGPSPRPVSRAAPAPHTDPSRRGSSRSSSATRANPASPS